MRADRPRVSVVVPSYRRATQLHDCLRGLAAQTRRPDEIVVVRRASDDETAAALVEWRGAVTEAVVTQPGGVAALQRGVECATGDIVAFVDDDAVPTPEWLERILAYFSDPTVGGVGGRDIIASMAEEPLNADVGRVTSWGRRSGNHHVGTGPVRNVEVLKGCNMAFRREALAIPTRLRGTGPQIHHEIATSLWARSRGWRLVYDPAVVVDHYLGERFDTDPREAPDRWAVADSSYNLTMALVGFEPELAWRRVLFRLAVGDRANPGLARALAAVVRGERDVLRRLTPSLLGGLAAARDVIRGCSLEMHPATDGGGGHERNRRPVAPVAHHHRASYSNRV